MGGNAAGSYVGPLYMQVAGALRQRIFAIEWPSHRPIPNEMVLAQEMRVSVGTMRKALEMLEREGLIERIKGRGTFVIEASEENAIERFSNIYVGDTKAKASQSSIEFSSGPATDVERKRLGLTAGALVHRINRLMIAPRQVLLHEQLIVPQERFPELEKIEGLSARILFHLYRRHYDVIVHKVSETVSAVTADDAMTEILRKKDDRAILRIDRIATALDVGPVEWAIQHVNLIDAQYRFNMK